jgi:hypothetical protein
METPKKLCCICAQPWPDELVKIATNCETTILYFCSNFCKDAAIEIAFYKAKENAKIFQSVIFKKVNYGKVKF